MRTKQIWKRQCKRSKLVYDRNISISITEYIYNIVFLATMYFTNEHCLFLLLSSILISFPCSMINYSNISVDVGLSKWLDVCLFGWFFVAFGSNRYFPTVLYFIIRSFAPTFSPPLFFLTFKLVFFYYYIHTNNNINLAILWIYRCRMLSLIFSTNRYFFRSTIQSLYIFAISFVILPYTYLLIE